MSLKTQELYLLVFITRYLDLLTSFHSAYNTIMKLIFLAASGYVVYLLRAVEPWAGTYDKASDALQHWKYAVAPCAVLALFVHDGSLWSVRSLWAAREYVMEALWAFSILLEAVAILPQIILLERQKCIENLTSWYIASLGAYRALYLANWAYRAVTEPRFHNTLAIVAGCVQTAFYLRFFWFFAIAKWRGSKFVILPS